MSGQISLPQFSLPGLGEPSARANSLALAGTRIDARTQPVWLQVLRPPAFRFWIIALDEHNLIPVPARKTSPRSSALCDPPPPPFPTPRLLDGFRRGIAAVDRRPRCPRLRRAAPPHCRRASPARRCGPAARGPGCCGGGGQCYGADGAGRTGAGDRLCLPLGSRVSARGSRAEFNCPSLLES